MAKYIDKSALVAEIERVKKEECPIDTYEGRIKLFYFERFLSFLDTLEVKEVGLDLGSPDGDMGVKTVWDGDKIVSTKTQKGE